MFHRVHPWDLLQKALPGSSLDDFGFDVPMIGKSTDGNGRRYVRGVASTPDKDLQDEHVIQKGMDLRYFSKHGYFNDDHKPGPEHKVGEPTKAEIKKIKDVMGKSVTGLWVEGYLWPEGVHKGADHIWELAKALEIANSKRQMGFSIQGKVLRRDGNTILKAWIQDIAITASPVNTATWLEVTDTLGKSMWATTEERNTLAKSIMPDTVEKVLLGDPDEEDEEKALGAASAVVPESLDRELKNNVLPFNKGRFEDPIAKSIKFCYLAARRRGYDAEMGRRVAYATVARTMLSQDGAV